ncbi:pentatricopeptide repeat-containing protein At1g11630, mitochondrial-like [Phoenix dactylifera]|uniref:Pentatricopeptide repeat-containing protein At1g11630, mitochondrial-like n=1 Tax=Phoenix dactylifera TaxID=42345 RepID=A0A8B7CPN3_PHODC|nr:pentatricopeptide repeat-containing protein At1g11630, mitochondrial-like [Phoenix dactylifera]
MAAAALRRNARFLLPRPRSSSLSTASSEAKPSISVSRAKSAIRAESDPDRLADLFLSATHSPAFHGDRPLYRLSIRRLAAARRPDLIERLLEHQKSDPAAPKSEGFLIRLLSLYSDAGMLDHAVRTFDHIASAGCPRSERSLCALLSAFLRHGRLDRLHEAFDRVPKELGIAPGISCYNVLLDALCSGGEVHKAHKLLEEMPEKGVNPDIISYNTVLSGFLKKGDETGFEGVLKKITKEGLSPNVVTYNCRISELCGKGKNSEAEELLDVMISKGVYPNRLSFNTLIDAFSKEGDVDSAMRVFKRMQDMKRDDGSGVSPNFEVYIVLLRGLVGKGKFGPGVEVFKECLERKWAPPFEAVKGLVDGLIENSQVDEAKDIVAKMRKVLKGDAVDAWKKVEGEFAL